MDGLGGFNPPGRPGHESIKQLALKLEDAREEIERKDAALNSACQALANVGYEVRAWLNSVGLLVSLDRAVEDCLAALAPVADASKGEERKP